MAWRWTSAAAIAMLMIVALAAVFRLVDLDRRPMHCDEAVHAIMFGGLLPEATPQPGREADPTAGWVYDPHEYHGPTLAFLTVPIARFDGIRSLPEVQEWHLRLVPALAGIALVGLAWPLRDDLGRTGVLWAALLTAVSPAMVFFSRYYIQEMLLVFFTFGALVAGWRWWRLVAPCPEMGEGRVGRIEQAASGSGSWWGSLRSARPTADGGQRGRWRAVLWLIVLGACLGLMHASKETCVIAWFSIAVGVGGTLLLHARGGRWPVPLGRLAWAAVIVIATGAIVSAVFFSSFLQNPRGVVDSVATFTHYLDRAGGEGSAGPHDAPWYRYLQWLFWWSPGERVWTEWPIAVLAVVGLVAALLGRGLPRSGVPLARVIGLYTLTMLAVYSAIAYKTPWCALGPLHGLILLAGIGAAAIVAWMPGFALKGVATVLLLVAPAWLGWQAYRASFALPAAADNPYVYAHTTDDVSRLADRVRELAAATPDGRQTHVQVVCPDADFWPLPWYLRDMPRVAWFADVPQGRPAPVIVMQPAVEDALLGYLFTAQPPGERRLYMPVEPEAGGTWALRPHVPLRLYARLDAFERDRQRSSRAVNAR